jgi:hypothetical protein
MLHIQHYFELKQTTRKLRLIIDVTKQYIRVMLTVNC